MSTVTVSGRTRGPQSGDKGKKIMLVVLVAVLGALLAYQVPKIMNRSSSASQAPAATEVATTPTEATSGEAAAGAGAVENVPGATPGATPATGAKAKAGALAFRKLPARDPFVPLAGQVATTEPTTVTPPQDTASHVQAPIVTVPETPASGTISLTPTSEVTAKLPTVAVVFINGKMQAIETGQIFTVGKLRIQLVGIAPKTVQLAAVNGTFPDGKRTLTIRRGQVITLENAATGESNKIRFKVPSGKPTGQGSASGN